jgi:hypothetical protein
MSPLHGCRLWQRIDYTQKVVNFRQVVIKQQRMQKLKYTQENLTYYLLFGLCIQKYPLDKLKFCDESHFRAKGTVVSLNFQICVSRGAAAQKAVFWP